MPPGMLPGIPPGKPPGIPPGAPPPDVDAQPLASNTRDAVVSLSNDVTRADLKCFS